MSNTNTALPFKKIGQSHRTDVDDRILINSLEELKNVYPIAHAKLLRSHALAIMEPGSIILGSGMTLLFTDSDTNMNRPKYFVYLFPGETIGNNSNEQNAVRNMGLVKIGTNIFLGTSAYLGARGAVFQHFGSPQAHALAVQDAGVLRVSNIDTLMFKDKDNEVRISSTETILSGNKPNEAVLALTGGTADSGRWLNMLFAIMSPDYVLTVLQNYVQADIDISLDDILEVIRVVKRTFMLGDSEVSPTINISYGDIVDWKSVLRKTPLLKGWTY